MLDTTITSGAPAATQTAAISPAAILGGSALNLGSRTLDDYMRAVGQYPVLDVAEEKAIAERYVNDNDLDAAQALVLHNLRFVIHIARGYQGYGLQLSDLIQEGNVGLMKAVKRYNPDRGVRLVAFAVHWVKAEIHEYVLKNWRVVKVATTKAQRKLFFNLRRFKDTLNWFSADEIETVAKELGVKPHEVSEMEKRLSGQDIGFDLDNDDDDDRAYAPAQYLQSEVASPEDLVIAEDSESRALDALKTSLASLDDRSRSIIQRRWLDEDKATLHDLADEFGVSAERIRQIEKAALSKLGNHMQG